MSPLYDDKVNTSPLESQRLTPYDDYQYHLHHNKHKGSPLVVLNSMLAACEKENSRFGAEIARKIYLDMKVALFLLGNIINISSIRIKALLLKFTLVPL